MPIHSSIASEHGDAYGCHKSPAKHTHTQNEIYQRVRSLAVVLFGFSYIFQMNPIRI